MSGLKQQSKFFNHFNGLLAFLFLLLGSFACQSPSPFPSSPSLDSSPKHRWLRDKHDPSLSVQNIPELIQALNNIKTREKARKKLVSLGKESTESLLQCAQDEKEKRVVRETAIYTLAEIGDKKAILPLLEVLKENLNNSLAVFLIQALADLKAHQSIPVLVELLQHKSLRSSAAIALGKINDKKIAPIIWPLLPEASPDFQKALITCLGDLKAQESLPMLLKQLYSSDKGVYLATLYALGQIGDGRAVDPIRETLSEDNLEIYVHGILTLGALKERAALPTLLKALQDNRTNVRSVAIQALGESGLKEGLKYLFPLVKKQKDALAEEAIDAMGKIVHADSARFLFRVANNHGNSFLRWKAGQSLVSLKEIAVPFLIQKLNRAKARDKAVELLIRMGPNASNSLHKAYKKGLSPRIIIFVLGEIKDKRSVSFLLQELKDDLALDLQLEIIRSLGKIGETEALVKLQTWIKKKKEISPLYHALLLTLLQLRDKHSVDEALDYIEKHQENVPLEFIEILASFHDSRVDQVLVNLLIKTKEESLAKAIAQNLTPPLAPQLIDKLASIVEKRKNPIKIYIYGFLARQQNQKAFHELVFIVFENNNTHLRPLAVAELVTLPPEKTLDYLIPLLRDEDHVIQTLVRELLIRVSGGKDYGLEIEEWKKVLEEKK